MKTFLKHVKGFFVTLAFTTPIKPLLVTAIRQAQRAAFVTGWEAAVNAGLMWMDHDVESVQSLPMALDQMAASPANVTMVELRMISVTARQDSVIAMI